MVPSWAEFFARSEAGGDDSGSEALDQFVFGDAPIFEKLDPYRSEGK